MRETVSPAQGPRAPAGEVKRPWRVRFFYTTYVSDGIEGISKNITHFAQALAGLGCKVELHAPEVDVEELNRKGTYFIRALQTLADLRRVMADEEMDLIHYHLQLPGVGLVPRIARRLTTRRVPIVGHLWNAYLTPHDLNGLRGVGDLVYHMLFNSAVIARQGLEGLDALLLPSYFQMEQVEALGYAGPLFHVPNGVDTEVYRPATPEERLVARATFHLPLNAPVVLYYGHFTRWKGVDHLVQAFRRVLEAFPDAFLLLAWSGYGQGRGVMVRLRDPGLRDRVKLVGRVHVPDLHAAADVAVLPLVSPVGTACHPNVLLECLSAGLPTVATDVGSIPELVEDGERGLLVPPADQAALAEALGRLLGDPSWARRLGMAARDFVMEGYRWEDVALDLLGAYAEVVP